MENRVYLINYIYSISDCSSNIDNNEHCEPTRKVFIVSPQEEQIKCKG